MSTLQELLARKAELDQQAQALERQLQEARRDERQQVIAKVKALLVEHGLTVADLGIRQVDGRKVKTARSTVAPKYRHPKTGETWSGRGLRPRWLTEALKEPGTTLESFAL